LRESISFAPVRWRSLVAVAVAALTALTALAVVPDADAKKKGKSVPVKVMTRNIFLGADLGPALSATGFESFIEANGAILREVDATNFPLRAKGLAGEFKQKKPDLVGLQEVALWRTGPAAIAPAVPGPPVATTVKYDFLQILLDELKAAGLRYKVVVVKEEFDFEAPADYNDVEDDGPLPDAGGENDLNDAEINGRLTMRDVILVNKDSKVKAKAKNPRSGTFSNIYTPTVSGIDIPVTRGWTAADVKVQKGKGKKQVKRSFRFVNSHFEAFDDETQVPSIRAQQAAELLATGAKAKRVILLGDFNSDVPGVQPGDAQAYQTLLDGGFREVSTDERTSCCVSNLFSSPPSEFDHRVDHVMTNQPKGKVKLLGSSITGLAQVNGIYNSDHAGVFSKLKLK
jgi:hypothetical protein